ncbi:unnamed protein product [Prorocentrum cordatum]|uniref:Uncharacterized protein n=1 Tax=Prorocentrum cordatum TaxID=2364126 RepID=A0ABN9TZ62_9DINO|nr:unnamed protein product [Polarella glacialis]
MAAKKARTNEEFMGEFRNAQSMDDKLLVMFRAQVDNQTFNQPKFGEFDQRMDIFEGRLTLLEGRFASRASATRTTGTSSGIPGGGGHGVGDGRNQYHLPVSERTMVCIGGVHPYTEGADMKNALKAI